MYATLHVPLRYVNDPHYNDIAKRGRQVDTLFTKRTRRKTEDWQIRDVMESEK